MVLGKEGGKLSGIAEEACWPCGSTWGVKVYPAGSTAGGGGGTASNDSKQHKCSLCSMHGAHATNRHSCMHAFKQYTCISYKVEKKHMPEQAADAKAKAEAAA